jgi:hypothetical protein
MTSSILLLAFMLALVLLHRGRPSVRVRKTGPSQYGPAQTGWGRPGPKSETKVKVGRPDKVSYELMDGKRLPSSSQLRMRRIFRPFGAAWRWVRPGKSSGQGEQHQTHRPDRKSAELENFLEARNKEIERRKADAAKRGPEDQLH